MHHLHAALRAHNLFLRDQHYVVQNDEVIIVDEFTGRLMAGRRWSDGLHQAVEAKEQVEIQNENQTLASITFQNYFRMYEQARRHDRHRRHRGLRVPGDLRPRGGGDPDPHADDPRGPARPGLQDRAREVPGGARRHPDCYERGQPVLVGTTSIENSEMLAAMLQKEKLAAPGAERQAARPRGADRRPGRPAEDDHHRDQHGRPRHRHRARRQRREAGRRGQGRPEPRRGREERARRRAARRMAARCTSRSSTRAACTSSAPSATSRGASTTSCAAAPAARATRAPRASTSSLEDPLLRIFAGERINAHHGAAEDARGRADRAHDRHPLDRERAAQGRGAQLRHPQAAPRVRRRRQRPAQERLRAAQPDPREPGRWRRW